MNALIFLAATCGDFSIEKLMGTRPADWQVADWINSKPLSLKDLDGKVVLVRWWLAPGCPYCVATAPSLNRLHADYRDRGLVVVGFYHHKALEPLKIEDVKQAADKLGFRFPVAVDHDWKTLRRWWLDGEVRRFTSVTFVLDRKGAIRHIHRGGQYAPDEPAFQLLKNCIEELLREK